jgi:EAL domain-containing protein (putative c-di-GMP-specific phosphodiesterase class I)
MATREAPATSTVLAVDDDEQLLGAIVRVLERDGFSVISATNADDALAAVARGGLDVLVSDIAMPGKDGIELLRATREHDLDLPVVLMTGAPDLVSAVAAVEYGALRYLTKPFELESLVEVVRDAARLRRLASAKRQALSLLGTHTGEASDRAGLEAIFARTLASLWMAYQPIVRAEDGSLYGYEALMRSDERSLPHPLAILDAAERLRRLPDLSQTIRSRIVADLQRAEPGWAIFVNLHPSDLDDPAMVGTGASPFAEVAQTLVLEVTERAALEGIADVAGKCARLRDRGHRIAIDDLGAGYAGLSSFVQLRPDVVKLDATLTRSIHGDGVRRKIVRGMTTLCREMGLIVVAEGVEVERDRDALIELGCDLLQGYLFGRPHRPFATPVW